MTAPAVAAEVTAGSPRARQVETGRFRVSDALFPPRLHIPSHYHDRAVLSVVIGGRFLQTLPGRSCDCPPGGVIVKPPGVVHVDRWYDSTSHHLIVEADPGAFEQLGACAALMEETRHVVSPAAEGLARRIVRELAGDDPARELAVEALTLELMVRILRGLDTRHAHRDPPGWLERVRQLLHDRFREKLGLDELAGEAGVHPTHLSRTFAEHFPVGVTGYLRQLRLESARRELADTDDAISRIAHRNGFADQSHLTRALKKATGLTPAVYRRTYGLRRPGGSSPDRPGQGPCEDLAAR